MVPPPPASEDANDDDADDDAPARAGSRSRYRPWAELLKRTFPEDRTELCPRCGGPLRLVALVQDPAGIARYLRHLGEPTEPPPLGPARGPPYFTTSVRRRGPEPPADFFAA